MAAIYRLRIAPVARRQIAQLPRQVQGKLRLSIRSLGTTPRPRGAKLLSTDRKLWRIRVGDYRIIYEIRDGELIVLVIRVGHRRDVYRRGRGG